MTATGLSASLYQRRFAKAVQQDPYVLATQPTKLALERLRLLVADWDGFESEQPNHDAISLAIQSLPDLVRGAEKVAEWSLPHVSANEDGEVIMEWWLGHKKLTIFVGPTKMDYLFTWGDRIDQDMVDGEFLTEAFPALWAQLCF
jgi:hypothetical protein